MPVRDGRCGDVGQCFRCKGVDGNGNDFGDVDSILATCNRGHVEGGDASQLCGQPFHRHDGDTLDRRQSEQSVLSRAGHVRDAAPTIDTFGPKARKGTIGTAGDVFVPGMVAMVKKW